MCTVILALGFLLQQNTGSAVQLDNGRLDQFRQAAEKEALTQTRKNAADRETDLEEKQFVQRFNELVSALAQFSKKYKSEHAIDVKSVQSIRKAYRNLEKADPWFKAQE